MRGGCRVIGLANVVMLVVMLAMGGCQARNGGELTRVQRSYRSGDFAAAYNQGRTLADSSRGQTHYEAAYIAGKAARRLKDLRQAERYLRVAAVSADPNLLGPAQAELGLVLESQGRYVEATSQFLQAATRLQGEDRAQAYLHAGLCEQKHGRWVESRNHFRKASTHARGSELRRQIQTYESVTAFTLQFGAFTHRSNAEKLARSLTTPAQRYRMGTPRMVSTRNSGKSLYLVQAGRFNSFNDARRAQARMQQESYVVPLSESR